MKEVTYEEWQKNPTPRMMWVWDGSRRNKVIRKVIYFNEKSPSHPVVVLTSDNALASNYKHCAEIEKPRRRTNKELAQEVMEMHKHIVELEEENAELKSELSALKTCDY